MKITKERLEAFKVFTEKQISMLESGEAKGSLFALAWGDRGKLATQVGLHGGMIENMYLIATILTTISKEKNIPFEDLLGNIKMMKIEIEGD